MTSQYKKNLRLFSAQCARYCNDCSEVIPTVGSRDTQLMCICACDIGIRTPCVWVACRGIFSWEEEERERRPGY